MAVTINSARSPNWLDSRRINLTTRQASQIILKNIFVTLLLSGSKKNLKNSTQVEIDSLEEEIEDNNQRLDEIHSLLKAFKNNVVGGEQISVDKKQYHLELEKEHREVEKQLYRLNKKLKSLIIERKNY